MPIRSPKPTNEVNWDDPLNKGLVAWYPMKQKGGNVLRDVVGGYHCTLESSMTSDDWVASPETNSLALDFDGTDDYLTTGIDAESWGQVTLSYWFWSEAGSQPDSYAVTVWSQGNQVGFYQDNYRNNYYCRLKTENGTVNVLVGSDFNTGGWHHVAMTWDGQTVRTYKDATFNSDGNLTGSIVGPGEFMIAGHGLNYFKGKISDVRIYDRGLLGSEVHDLYQASRTGYVDQFKRRSIPFGVTSIPAESHPSNGLIRLRSPKQSQPSYKAGYAKSASESAYPNLWKDFWLAWVPQLEGGIFGGKIKNIAGRPAEQGGNNDGNLTGLSPSNLVPTERGLGLDLDGSSYIAGDNLYSPILPEAGRPWTFSMGYRSGVYSDLECFLSVGDTPTDNTPTCAVQRQSSTAMRIYHTGDFRVSDVPFVDNETAHFVISYDGAVLSLFKNAELQGTYSSTSLTIASTTDELYFGSGYKNSGHGIINELMLWDRCLDLDEIQTLYRDPVAPFRQRRSFPVSLPSEPTTPTTKTSSVIRVKSNVQPSYKTGYAKSASESAYPELWDGLVGAWMPSFGATGQTLRDVSGNRNHGTLTNMDPATDWVTSEKGLVLDFDGTDDYVQTSDITLSAPQFTISLWVKFDSTSGVPTIACSSHYYAIGYDGNFLLRLGNDNIHFVSYNGKSDEQFSGNAGLVTSNRWYHIVVTGDGTNSKIYKDGIRQLTFAQDKTLTDLSDGGLLIGDDISWNNDPLNGQVANALLYKRALTEREILDLHADSLAPFRQRRYFPVSLQDEFSGLVSQPDLVITRLGLMATPFKTYTITDKGIVVEDAKGKQFLMFVF